MILLVAVDHCHKLLDFLIGNGDLHSLAAKHIGRAHQHRIAKPVGHGLCLLCRVNRTACSSRNLRLLQNPVKKLPILRRVHVLRLCAKNRHAHLHQAFRQLDSRLSAKLHHRTVGLLHIDDVLHILRCQRLEIELVRNVKVCAHRLRVVVDDDGFIAFPRKRPGGVHRTVVKLDALPDADRARA